MNQKEIITKLIFKNDANNDEVIFHSSNAYELKEQISFPYGAETTILQGNKIIIAETEYLITEITLDILRPESELFENNLQIIIFLSKAT